MLHIIVGTRAQIIKMAPLMRVLEDKEIDYNFIFLAQHKETMYEIMTQFGIKKPDIIIGDMGKDITQVKEMIFWSFRVLIYSIFKSKLIFRDDKHGIVLIHGDAPPLLLGALMAKRQGLKVAQVEAGLRSFNYLKPFPEEITRVFSSKAGLIDIFFCQDEKAAMNVAQYKKTSFCTHYNTILDSLRLTENVELKKTIAEASGQFAIVSLHRFETISKKEKLEQVVKELIKISRKIKLLFILHPPTRVALKKMNLYELLEQEPACHLLPRLGFFEFNQILRNTEFIITDGGSNQEECFYLGVP
ncbi:MAG: UDP-N-acetylglucosamine 2-epimerase, partial [Nitrospinota bacterium]|nr:UDP-N-acetylglucosamine 2-epimerase [Nitrospinota bacterium]